MLNQTLSAYFLYAVTFVVITDCYSDFTSCSIFRVLSQPPCQSVVQENVIYFIISGKEMKTSGTLNPFKG